MHKQYEDSILLQLTQCTPNITCKQIQNDKYEKELVKPQRKYSIYIMSHKKKNNLFCLQLSQISTHLKVFSLLHL